MVLSSDQYSRLPHKVTVSALSADIVLDGIKREINSLPLKLNDEFSLKAKHSISSIDEDCSFFSPVEVT